MTCLIADDLSMHDIQLNTKTKLNQTKLSKTKPN